METPLEQWYSPILLPLLHRSGGLYLGNSAEDYQGKTLRRQNLEDCPVNPQADTVYEGEPQL